MSGVVRHGVIHLRSARMQMTCEIVLLYAISMELMD